jgi:hypothetical protein
MIQTLPGFPFDGDALISGETQQFVNFLPGSIILKKDFFDPSPAPFETFDDGFQAVQEIVIFFFHKTSDGEISKRGNGFPLSFVLSPGGRGEFREWFILFQKTPRKRFSQ